MAKGLEQLSELKNAPKAPKKEEAAKVAAANNEQPQLREKEIDDLGRSYATGKCKTTATARVWIKRGSGKVTVCGKDMPVYFARPTQQMIIQQPLELAGRDGQYDIVCTVKGGGLSAQAKAVRHGVAQALSKYEPELRSIMKKAGFLTVDARRVERKKYGLKKARKRPQWKKR